MKKVKEIFEKIIKVILQAVYRLFGKEMSEEQWQVWLQFIGFALVGVSNFIISYGTYALFLSFGCNHHISNVMAFIISVINAFYWNNRYVFKEDEGEQRVWWKTLLKTYMSYAFSGLFLTEVLLFVEIDVMGLPKLLGPIINLAITTPINFVINKFWAFGNSGKEKKTEDRIE